MELKSSSESMSFFDLAIQVVDLSVDGFQNGIDGFAGQGAGGGQAAVALLGADVGELPPAGDQGIEFGLVFRAFFRQSRGSAAGEFDQDPGVDGIGLGQSSHALGEVANVAGVHQGDGKRSVQQGIEQRAFQSAGGLDDQGSGIQRAQEIDDLANALRIVGHGENLIAVRPGQIQLALGDVDPDKQSGGLGRGVCHAGDPFLRIRASLCRARGCGVELSRLFGRSDTRPACTTLRDGRGGPRHNRSWAGRRVRMTPRCARRHANTTARIRTIG